MGFIKFILTIITLFYLAGFWHMLVRWWNRLRQNRSCKAELPHKMQLNKTAK